MDKGVTRLSRQNPRVLIVDDSRSIRSYVTDLLVQAGYEVVTAVDGRDGLAAIDRDHPDVVLLDVEMPQLGGLEVLAQLQDSVRLFAVILFTTHSTLAEIVAGLAQGADDYIVKPFRDDELLARVAVAMRITREKQALSAARCEAEEVTRKLQNTQQLLVAEERTMAIAHLAAGAAHQINNPLGFICSNLQAFARYGQQLQAYIRELNAAYDRTGKEAGATIAALQQKHHLPRIQADYPDLLTETQQGAQRIALIVKSLGELELGLARHEPVTLDLNRLIYGIISTLGGNLPDHVHLDWVPWPTLVMVSGKLTLLNHAFSAIIANAVEAVAAPGGRIDVSCQIAGDQAMVHVRDNGCGMADLAPSTALAPFYSTKDPEQHCGLGLTIAERFFASHGGTVSLNPVIPSGLEVVVALPLAFREVPHAA